MARATRSATRADRSATRADAVVLAGCLAASLLATVLPPGARQAVAGAVRETVVGPLIQLQASVERARSAMVAGETRARLLDSLALRAADLADLERENARLRALAGLGDRLRTGFVAAEALRRPELGEASTVVVTAGRRHGVVERSVIVAAEGLVGTVIQAGEATSIALLWTHPDFRVSAMSADGAAFGIVAPHLGEAAGRFMLELRGVAFRDSLPMGTEVRSSGLGSVFPRGIPIGTVVGELDTAEGWSRTYLVRPAVMPADVSVVMVLLPAGEGVDMGGAWAAPATSEPAAADTAGPGGVKPDTGVARVPGAVR